MIQVPDLLNLRPRLSVDARLYGELLGLAFMGRETGEDIDHALAGAEPEPSDWCAEYFAAALFVKEMIDDWFTLTSNGTDYTINKAFLFRMLTNPPTDPEAIQFRQQIVVELESEKSLYDNAHLLYRELRSLLSMFKMPGPQMRLDLNVFRLDVLRQTKLVVDHMITGFEQATSGLRRLHEAGLEIRTSSEYQKLAALLDYEKRLSTLNVNINVGATGRITHLEIKEVAENKRNFFYRGPWHRMWDLLKSYLFYGYRLSQVDLVGRLIHRVYDELVSSLIPILQLVGHLEFYLTSLSFHEKARRRGLEVSLARFDSSKPLHLRKLFNPLLLRQGITPVPNSVQCATPSDVTLVTGPNSGGKTRFLQALGLAQLLGQSGIYTSASQADLPILHGMFVSLVERDTIDQTEGRLGQELRRIRTMFNAMGSSSMVIIDELCSGTNPSEAVEVFTLVLQLLEKLGPIAFITVHFLDYVRSLYESPPIGPLEFLQVEIDSENNSTYQFIPGVATTSLAAIIAQRLGVTYEELSSAIEKRRG